MKSPCEKVEVLISSQKETPDNSSVYGERYEIIL
jgi:hypothetical protein